MNNDLKYWVAFCQNTKMGQKRIFKLLSYFGNLEKAWQASRVELIKAGLEENLVEEILESRKTTNPDHQIRKIKEHQLQILTYRDKNYPHLLKEIYSPPALLYIKGKILPEDEIAVSIVGTRKPTNYGKQATYEIAYNLARSGITIVSGLALGIDSIAHKAALEAGGRTIAVMACGLDKVYPQSHQNLASLIEQSGALISEFPLGMPALAYNFPQRNRIISGLSLGVLVVEAPEGSGALITSQFAIDQNREVFALPGLIYSEQSRGPNNLIKQGAKIVTHWKDILDELNLERPEELIKSRKIIPESPEEEKILKLLSKKPIHIDIIIENTELPPQVVLSSLTTMEMKGKVRHIGSSNYIINQ